MSRKNQIDFVEAIYNFVPNINDERLANLVELANNFDYRPSEKTIATWKSTLRKGGTEIPDRRKNR